MGGEVINPTKPRFDLSMSKRTRKPWSSLINDTHHHEISTQSSQPKPDKEQEQIEDKEIDRKSLNNLMRYEEKPNGEANVNNDKSSLDQHFGDDEGIKQTMQLVVKKEKQGGVKFKGMMGRYVKVWSGLIKAKRDRKTPVLRFKT
ncbi:unnamed protein product [Arabidopsis lyrata]|uniref:Uncharacterized protein n=1 Tax=Arabidopsis lyrata subsp. lyrata TaxID=81972 RepID=D7MW81_ARALL|nr:uncharacterized protein LOC9299019 [Arabidopsis lyrata subsp. lyrata]EFH39190.1 hypothetical protein ARALYDRAFT_497238 [Arabidopsis lyrata subsp. lyrata]CAH8264425.1 unnamed protein product [Arabidopsis lyrata]|eukprot:XP_020873876.1 uncharacterized protein LOC9299019 [Arabidopsis lyrata subsp. lyrata]